MAEAGQTEPSGRVKSPFDFCPLLLHILQINFLSLFPFFIDMAILSFFNKWRTVDNRVGSYPDTTAQTPYAGRTISRSFTKAGGDCF